MTGPRVSSGRGESKQDYATPPDFMHAIAKRFGAIRFDLAASAENTKATCFYSERDDALNRDWSAIHCNDFERHHHLWLNPPFNDIAPWAKRCALYRDLPILLLVPASVGSNWFRDHVFPHARVTFLNGRICFDGKNGYPKDCMLCEYGPRANADLRLKKSMVEIWSWAA